MLLWKETGKKPSSETVHRVSATYKRWVGKWDQFLIESGKLYRRFENEEGTKCIKQLVIPKDIRPKVLQHCHAKCGHQGVDRTQSIIAKKFYWLGWQESVRIHCQTCTECQERKAPAQRPRAALKQVRSTPPLVLISIDVAGTFPITANKNRFVLVVVDYFTKFALALPMPDQQTETVCNALMKNFFLYFGSAGIIHSDQGSNFQSKLFKDFCKSLGMVKTQTTPGYPQSNAQSGHFIRTLTNMITKVVSAKLNDWDEHFPYLTLAYRSAVHSATKYTPNERFLGRDVMMPLDWTAWEPPDLLEKSQPQILNEYVLEMQSKMREAHHAVEQHLNTAFRRAANYFNLRKRQEVYKRGYLVLLYNRQRKVGISAKLGRHWHGPFVVLTALSDVVYRIQKSACTPQKVIHHNWQKRFFPREPIDTSWIDRLNPLPVPRVETPSESESTSSESSSDRESGSTSEQESEDEGNVEAAVEEQEVSKPEVSREEGRKPSGTVDESSQEEEACNESQGSTPAVTPEKGRGKRKRRTPQRFGQWVRRVRISGN